jgi:hypothetical protein
MVMAEHRFTSIPYHHVHHGNRAISRVKHVTCAAARTRHRGVLMRVRHGTMSSRHLPGRGRGVAVRLRKPIAVFTHRNGTRGIFQFPKHVKAHHVCVHLHTCVEPRGLVLIRLGNHFVVRWSAGRLDLLDIDFARPSDNRARKCECATKGSNDPGRGIHWILLMAIAARRCRRQHMLCLDRLESIADPAVRYMSLGSLANVVTARFHVLEVTAGSRSVRSAPRYDANDAVFGTDRALKGGARAVCRDTAEISGA